MNADEPVLNQISERIIRGAFAVANTLGSGFLEKVYENALAHELRTSGLPVAQQKGVVIRYSGIVVGEYTADPVVDGSVIVELKAVRALDNIHREQRMNYLRASGLQLCLLLNFGRPRLEIVRIVHEL